MHLVVSDRLLVDTTEARTSLEDPLVIKNEHIHFIYKQKKELDHILHMNLQLNYLLGPKDSGIVESDVLVSRTKQ